MIKNNGRIEETREQEGKRRKKNALTHIQPGVEKHEAGRK